MKVWLFGLLGLILGGLVTFGILQSKENQLETPVYGWQLVYAHTETGETISGAKEDLINAIQAGKPVRVGWSGSYVDHVTDGYFLTIIDGEVFAQIFEIRGQRPSRSPPNIELAEEGQNWLTVFATNGDRALRWFVQQ
ncbi:hypothetical protein [Hirschia maritima]|uniref:hypothetical protein n=1 Tax=Hirschia maritima TaxID=1121961 RepID=UPI00037E5875|nr:hypothetical protein [Hirschia maritima]